MKAGNLGGEKGFYCCFYIGIVIREGFINPPTYLHVSGITEGQRLTYLSQAMSLFLPFNHIQWSETAWTSSLIFLARIFSEVVCHCLRHRVERERLAQGHLAGIVPKARIEWFPVSSFMS